LHSGEISNLCIKIGRPDVEKTKGLQWYVCYNVSGSKHQREDGYKPFRIMHPRKLKEALRSGSYQKQKTFYFNIQHKHVCDGMARERTFFSEDAPHFSYLRKEEEGRINPTLSLKQKGGEGNTEDKNIEQEDARAARS
jgi:hypothetical protein